MKNTFLHLEKAKRSALRLLHIKNKLLEHVPRFFIPEKKIKV